MRKGSSKCQSSEVGEEVWHIQESVSLLNVQYLKGVLILSGLGTLEFPVPDTALFYLLPAKREVFCSSRGFGVDKLCCLIFLISFYPSPLSPSPSLLPSFLSFLPSFIPSFLSFYGTTSWALRHIK